VKTRDTVPPMSDEVPEDGGLKMLLWMLAGLTAIMLGMWVIAV
jgi:hypothetical protein